MVVVAGNHDCDFGTPSSSRSTNNGGNGVLANYFAFTRTLGLNYEPHSEESPYFVWHDVRIRDQVLRFLLVNTSLFSSIKEQPGSLDLPVKELYAHVDPPARYVVTVMHHPWNWFKQPEVMR